ncbi:MAG: EAL domain-containing protein [Kastovskya adunca ATA6-11-RM4]|jgi:diguanylate cyclase (GGDEF)-like protein/PAS domain S-box-containing protein|nr:EAL domain-containing protein [Kastovskya adunca ATA6-11-RM4]
MAQPSTLHLLIVEDVLEDVELILLALESATMEFTYDTADTGNVCQQLLQTQVYDAVLSDYRLPELNGFRALSLLQQSQQEIPFILVTGTLGEEAAVECIKSGMTDYVLKDRLFRLPTVLERALQEVELRRQQQAATIRIQQQAQRETIINRIVQAMRETLVLDEVLQTTVDQLHQVLQVSRCLIFQPDPSHQMRAKYVSEATVKGESLLGVYCDFYRYYHELLSEGQQVVFSKIDRSCAPEIQQSAKECNIGASLIMPLLYQQVYLGGISLHQCDRPRQWTDDEIALVKAIADQCAIAIHQVELYQQAQNEITERKRVESALRKSEQRFRALIENASDMIIILDAHYILRYVSPSAKRILGYGLKEAIGKSVFDFIHPDDVPLVTQLLNQVIANPGVSQPSVEYRVRHQNDSWCIAEAVATNLLDHSAVEGIVVNCHDITERKIAEDQLRYDAFHNPLTGLPNRELFMDRLEQAIKRSQRQDNCKFAVLFLDLDRFKVVNDSLGHLVGDRLLVVVARRLEQCLRSVDTAARLGGDEFVILLEDIADIDDATQVANRIHQELIQPIVLDEQEIFITASIGIALSAEIYDQPDHLLRDADAAMYCAKARGKACYVVFDTSMHLQARQRLQVENDLRRAVERQELVAHYQPIVSLQTNQICGFEALVRWQHPSRGLVFPGDFILIAEETGLIVAIDQWLLHQACQQLHFWQQRFATNPPLTMGVNLSGKQFSQPDLIQKIDQVLQDTGIDGRCLNLEITESALIENAELAAVMLKELKERQIQIYIDDFGTGYSSLSYLHHFPIDTLKIDRSFVSRLGVEGEKDEIVRAIINLGLNLRLNIVAEGVETAEQMQQLKAFGCHYGQGYWFSRPVDDQTITSLMSKQIGIS